MEQTNSDLQANNTDSVVPTQPCELKFLEALMNDLLKLTRLMSRKLLEIKLVNMGQTFPRDVAIVVMNLNKAMQQCRRLKDYPRLFPSLVSKTEFLQAVSKVLPIMAIIPELVAIKFGGDGYRILHIKKCEGSDEQWLTHPNTLGGKHPWNFWLENFAESTADWIGIEQRVPRVGDQLIRRFTNEYNTIEEDFEEVRVIICNKWYVGPKLK